MLETGNHGMALIVNFSVKLFSIHLLHVVRNVNRFCLRAHTLKVWWGLWKGRNFDCKNCDCQDIQDESIMTFKDTRAWSRPVGGHVPKRLWREPYFSEQITALCPHQTTGYPLHQIWWFLVKWCSFFKRISLQKNGVIWPSGWSDAHFQPFPLEKVSQNGCPEWSKLDPPKPGLQWPPLFQAYIEKTFAVFVIKIFNPWGVESLCVWSMPKSGAPHPSRRPGSTKLFLNFL
jgi:hypothetical protein